MNFLHTDFWGGTDHMAIVTLDAQANVLLVDDANFSDYQHGRSFTYYGGWATQSSVKLIPPHNSHWHVIIDLGGNAGSVRAGVRIIRNPASIAI